MNEDRTFELNCLKDKKQFVEDLGKVISKHLFGIEKLDYDVFEINGYIYEYLVVTYRGGAIATRNCRGNSLSAVFEEISKLLDGGYYEEVNDYRNAKSKSTKIEDLSL